MLASFLAMAPLPAEAGSTDTTQAEIQHLLQFVENSGCTFIRNGTVHTAADARLHIEKKYDYVKSRVSDAEDFIGYAATQSSMTGQPYKVNCDGVTITSNRWLTDELSRYRTGTVP